MKAKVSVIQAEVRRHEADLHAVLNELLQLSAGREGLEIEPAADPLDEIRSSTDLEIKIQVLDQQAHLIREIRSAPVRIQEGRYGLCEVCEQALLPKRLAAVPWARLCVQCQDTDELQSGILFDRAA